MTITAQPMTAPIARAYIRRIRNPRKQAYATAYLHHLTMDGAPEPASDDFQPLSYMAAQAVRMELGAILRGEVRP